MPLRPTAPRFGRASYFEVASSEPYRDLNWIYLRYGVVFTRSGIPERVLRQAQNGDVLVLKDSAGLVTAAGTIEASCPADAESQWIVDGEVFPASALVQWTSLSRPAAVPNLTELSMAPVMPGFPECELDILMSEGTRVEPALRRPVMLPVLTLAEVELLIGQRAILESRAPDVVEALWEIRLRLDATVDWRRTDRDAWRRWKTLVAPLIRALGWEKMVHEHRYQPGWVSVYFPSAPGSRMLVVQVQNGTQGLDLEANWAERYRRQLRDMDVILAITNGISYKIYDLRDEPGASSPPTAVLDMVRPTARYQLAPEIPGAVEALCLMA